MKKSEMLTAIEELAAIKESRRKAASIGGKARAEKVSPRRLKAIARIAGLASAAAKKAKKEGKK